MKRRRKKVAKNVGKQAITAVDIGDYYDDETFCQVCQAEFLDEDDLKLHVAQVHIKESHGKTICPFCCAVLPGPLEFVTHFIFKHIETCAFCYYCHRVFTDSSQRERHKMKHCVVADDSALTCSQCATIFINRQELQKHEYEEHSDSDDGFMLNQYFSLLSSALCIKIKKFMDNTHKGYPFLCRKCTYVSLTLTPYIKHLKHGNCQCLSCDKCFNVYKKRRSMVGHMRRCPYFNTKEAVKKKCLKCNVYFDSKDLCEHKKSCKVFKCFTCLKLFDSVNELTTHRNKEHNIRISLMDCKFCKKQFVGTLALKKHLRRTHKDRTQYKYQCVYCDSIFNHPRRLFAHFYTQHKDIRPYTCKICNKSFRIRKQFTIHIKLEHKSIGFVEFEENWHVIFTDKKSENPKAPQASVDMDSTDFDSENEHLQVKKPVKKNNNVSKPLPIKNSGSNDNSPSKSSDSTIQVEIEPFDEPGKDDRENIDVHISPDDLSDNSDVPLSNIKSILKTNTRINIKRKVRDKRAKLTCKVCGKYCYTVQNFHHHMTLHEKTKMKRCIKCSQYFKSKQELKEHIESAHTSSRLIETLKCVVEKRKQLHPVKPSESFKTVLERRRKQQLVTAHSPDTNKFRRTIQKVDIIDNCSATITPIMGEGLSVKNFIENFKPDEGLSVSNSVTLKAVTTPTIKKPVIKMRAFKPEIYSTDGTKLRFPVKFKDSQLYQDTKISVKLVQQLVTKPSAVNMKYEEKIPLVQETSESDDYCNMFADETDYTEYKNESIPDVAQEVMLEDLDDIPRTKRLAREIIIPKIGEEYGGVRIGHLLPQAPYFKIVKVQSLLNPPPEDPDPIPERDVKLPDGTRLISVKNPYSHLIPNDHLRKILKANSTASKYYQPRTKDIEKAIAKALCDVKPPRKKKAVKKET